MGSLGCLGERLGRLWETKWPREATILAPWGHFGGSWAAFGVALGCSWGDFGGQKGDHGGPKTGQRAIWGSKGPLEGSWGQFGNGFGVEKGVFLGVKAFRFYWQG